MVLSLNKRNIVSDNIQLKIGESTFFDLDLRWNLIVIEGFSGQGKTYFFNALRNAKYSEFPTNVKGVDLTKVEFINIFTKGLVDLITFLKSKEGMLFVIDNADFVLTEEIAEYIGWDNKNQYIIFSRANWPFGLSPNYYAKMIDNNGIRTLEYEYQNEGWK